MPPSPSTPRRRVWAENASKRGARARDTGLRPARTDPRLSGGLILERHRTRSAALATACPSRLPMEQAAACPEPRDSRRVLRSSFRRSFLLYQSQFDRLLRSMSLVGRVELSCQALVARPDCPYRHAQLARGLLSSGVLPRLREQIEIQLIEVQVFQGVFPQLGVPPFQHFQREC